VVRPYLTGEDIAEDPAQAPRRWIIDFAQRPLEEANTFPAAMQIVRDRVKPVRESNRRELYRRMWWTFGEPRPGMRRAIQGQARWLASLAFGKRLLLAWQDVWTCPSGKIYVFAFDDDFAMGILTSRAHGVWAWKQGATLKADLSYTPTSVFETFPWPYPTSAEQRDRVAEVCRRLLARRSEICQQEQIGLTRLYNAVEDGAWADLKALHRELDEAVVACYGWPAPVAQDDAELVRLLTERNREVSEGVRPYEPFAHLVAHDPSEHQPSER